MSVRNSTVFPDPFGPMMARDVARGTAKLRSRRISRSSSRTERCSTSSVLVGVGTAQVYQATVVSDARSLQMPGPATLRRWMGVNVFEWLADWDHRRDAGPLDERATLFEVGLPISGRHLVLARTIRRLVRAWIPLVACALLLTVRHLSGWPLGAASGPPAAVQALLAPAPSRQGVLANPFIGVASRGLMNGRGE